MAISIFTYKYIIQVTTFIFENRLSSSYAFVVNILEGYGIYDDRK